MVFERSAGASLFSSSNPNHDPCISYVIARRVMRDACDCSLLTRDHDQQSRQDNQPESQKHDVQMVLQQQVCAATIYSDHSSCHALKWILLFLPGPFSGGSLDLPHFCNKSCCLALHSFISFRRLSIPHLFCPFELNTPIPDTFHRGDGVSARHAGALTQPDEEKGYCYSN